jgi:RHS repeat-associated protein
VSDYYPFGTPRIDQRNSSFNEQRKFAGTIRDDSTGLDYMQARYYSGARGQFLSEDPLFIGSPAKQDLSNPQGLNPYVYALDNPITNRDPNGRKVELISRPVFNVGGLLVDEHTFFLITPDNPSSIQIQGVPSGATAFTMGGYPAGNPLWTKLTKSIGTADSTGLDTEYAFNNGKTLNRVTITPPSGQSDTQFINGMGAAYNSIDLSGVNYYGPGRQSNNTPVVSYANSNNFAYTLGAKSGVQSQMNSFVPNPSGAALGNAPGFGYTVPTRSLYQQVLSLATTLVGQLTTFINSHK